MSFFSNNAPGDTAGILSSSRVDCSASLYDILKQQSASRNFESSSNAEKNLKVDNDFIERKKRQHEQYKRSSIAIKSGSDSLQHFVLYAQDLADEQSELTLVSSLDRGVICQLQDVARRLMHQNQAIYDSFDSHSELGKLIYPRKVQSHRYLKDICTKRKYLSPTDTNHEAIKKACIRSSYLPDDDEYCGRDTATSKRKRRTRRVQRLRTFLAAVLQTEVASTARENCKMKSKLEILTNIKQSLKNEIKMLQSAVQGLDLTKQLAEAESGNQTDVSCQIKCKVLSNTQFSLAVAGHKDIPANCEYLYKNAFSTRKTDFSIPPSKNSHWSCRRSLTVATSV